MKLFIWENVLCDNSCGFIAIAGNTKKSALKNLKKKLLEDVEERKISQKRTDGYGSVLAPIVGTWISIHVFQELEDREPDKIVDIQTGTVIAAYGSS